MRAFVFGYRTVTLNMNERLPLEQAASLVKLLGQHFELCYPGPFFL